MKGQTSHQQQIKTKKHKEPLCVADTVQMHQKNGRRRGGGRPRAELEERTGCLGQSGVLLKGRRRPMREVRRAWQNI